MRRHVKPRIVVSRCLGFDNCRYDGLGIASRVVDRLRPHVDFITVCPEVGIGLGIPRDPIRVISAGGRLKLVQPETGRDITVEMRDFTETFLSSVGEVDGFILKKRSPSCGTREVKIFTSADSDRPVTKKTGFFGGAVLERFFYLPVVDENRLLGLCAREHFLVRIFALASFRGVKAARRVEEVAGFQNENRMLLMAYNKKELRILDRIAANPEKGDVDEILQDYEEHLRKTFLRSSRYTSNIDVMMHAFGFFYRRLSQREKAFFLDTLGRYIAGAITLGECLKVMRLWIARFEVEPLMSQTFFKPYPAGLVDE